MGHIELAISLAGLLVTFHGFNMARNRRVERKLERILHLKVEHEILIRDYCERHKIRPRDLPTRNSDSSEGGD